MVRHFLDFIREQVLTGKDNPALTDLEGNVHYSYGEMAVQMERLSVLFDLLGIEEGEKIALCGKNCSNWVVAFLAIAAAKRVVVSILPEFTPENIHTLVEHSDAKMLFAGPVVWKSASTQQWSNLKAVVSLVDFSLLSYASDEIADRYAKWDEEVNRKCPNGINTDSLSWQTDNLNDLVLINYTSGTTSQPKGVMLSNENISNNVEYGQMRIPNHPGQASIVVLPLAHMFGLVLGLLYQLAGGTHCYFLGRNPSPTSLIKAFQQVRPYMLVTVPLILEKVVRKNVIPALQKQPVKFLWHTPGLRKIVQKKIFAELQKAFGGQLGYVEIGGAALSAEVEKILVSIGFPITVGYGMTETAPLIGYEDWQLFRPHTCGRIVGGMELRIDSSDPHKEVGEVQVRGKNVMMGYYKNEEATKAAFTEDGWLKTGDLGVVDKDGYIQLRGRSKNMILGASGQNIYPEEIEDQLNNLEGVAESVVVERDGKLVGLVYPESLQALGAKYDELKDRISEQMKANLEKLNKLLPNFSKVSKIEVVDKEFEKTPKRSIKRFLYK